MAGDDSLSDKYPAPANLDSLLYRFERHTATEEHVERFNKLRAVCQAATLIIVGNTPPSREQSLALTALQDCCMWAMEAIMVNEKP